MKSLLGYRMSVSTTYHQIAKSTTNTYDGIFPQTSARPTTAIAAVLLRFVVIHDVVMRPIKGTRLAQLRASIMINKLLHHQH